MHSTDARAANVSHEPTRLTFPAYLIALGDGSYHTLWGEVHGQDVTGVPVFGSLSLAHDQIEQDAITGANIVEIESPSSFRQIAATLVDAWLFYFRDDESEMSAVKASQL